MSFNGAKLAILARGGVVTILRDDIATIPWPDWWDLPGGAREGDETPEACALREAREELGIEVPRVRLVWQREHPAWHGNGTVWFLVAEWPEFDPDAVRFGDEGQGWRLMELAEFGSHPRVIPHLRRQLHEYLDLRGTAAFP